MKRARRNPTLDAAGCSDPRIVVLRAPRDGYLSAHATIIGCETCHEVWRGVPSAPVYGPPSPALVDAWGRYEAWMAAD